MPLLTTVIDDKSPLINYDPTWLPGNSWDDQLATLYYLGTFTTNNVTDGFLTFNFNGSAIWIYGAMRTNHGSFTVQVDSATYSNLNGDANNVFQQPLFNTSSLSQGMHTVRLTNTASGNLYVDIDMIVWQSQVGNANDHLVTEVVQDTDSRFQYQGSVWAANSANINLNLFNNGSGHITQTYNANVIFTFTGMLVLTSSFHLTDKLSAEAVSLFGTSGPSNGQYSVQLDGGQTTTYNASNSDPTNYGVMIYHADNLGPGTHQIVLTNLPTSQSEQFFAVDYAQLWAAASTPAPGASSGNSTTDFIVSSTLSSGAIAGIAVAAAVAVLSAGVALFFYRRWKAVLAERLDRYPPDSPQRHLTESNTILPTGLSSSLETSHTSVHDPTPAFSVRTRQRDGTQAIQFDRALQSTSGIRHSTGVPEVDNGSGRRPLPEAPGGGLTLAAELPKLAGTRSHLSVMLTDGSSIAVSEAPPNYTQATENVAPTHR